VIYEADAVEEVLLVEGLFVVDGSAVYEFL
jgi:hypothetical protein